MSSNAGSPGKRDGHLDLPGIAAGRRRGSLGALAWSAGAALAVCFAVVAWASVRDDGLEGTSHRDNALVVATERLLSSLKDVETGERGFIITGKDQYLEPYAWGTAAVGPDLATIRSILGDVATSLSDLVTARLHEAVEGIDSYRRDGSAAAAASIQSGAGKLAMDRVRVEVAGLQRDANARLASARDERAFDGLLRALSLAGLALSCVALGYVALRRRREHLANRGLLDDVLRNAPVGLGFLGPDLSLRHMNRALSQAARGWIAGRARRPAMGRAGGAEGSPAARAGSGARQGRRHHGARRRGAERGRGGRGEPLPPRDCSRSAAATMPISAGASGSRSPTSPPHGPPRTACEPVR